MSHYTRKEACVRCGSYEYDCGCPIVKVKSLKQWTIDPNTYKVITVEEFDKQCSERGQFGLSYRMYNACKVFDKKKDAQLHRIKMLEEKILETRRTLAELESCLTSKDK
jgi:hypothetical protein